MLKTLAEGSNNFCGLLVCILNNKDSTWLTQLHNHLPWLNVTTDWEEFKKLPNPRLLVLHYQDFVKYIKRLVKYKKLNWAAFDEAHGLKGRGSAQSRAAARMAWVERRLILTGTPIDKEPADLWAQFRFLAPEAFGTRWADFEEEYMVFDQISLEGIPPGTQAWERKVLQNRILRSRATFNEEKRDQFNEILFDYGLRVTKQDVGIEQAKVEKIVVPMSVDQKRMYRSIKKRFFAYTKSQDVVSAPLEVTRIVKRRQIASGFVYDDEDEVHYLPCPKTDKMLEMIDDAAKPVVVFVAHVPELLRITKRLKRRGYRVGVLYGKVKKKERPQLLKDFQRAQYDVFVCQQRAGGVGVDMWKARTAFVHSITHSFIDWDQMKSRLDTRDRNAASEFFIFCSENSIDEELFDLVISKGVKGDDVLKRLKRRSRSWQSAASRRTRKPKPRRRPCRKRPSTA